MHDAGVNHHILRVFSVGRVQEDGILAMTVLLFKDML